MQKQKLNNYYAELPQGFKEVYRIDAKKTSVSVIFTIGSLVIFAAVFFACYFAKFGAVLPDLSGENDFFAPLIVLCVSLIAYLVVHELTHGAAYKLLTRQKLTFGLTLTVAYCGLKEGYVNKKTAIIAILAPFVLHSVWMILLICLLTANAWCLAVIVLFALHFGGCIGDLYGTAILVFKCRNCLMYDSGPCQIFYEYRAEEVAQE